MYGSSEISVATKLSGDLLFVSACLQEINVIAQILHKYYTCGISRLTGIGLYSFKPEDLLCMHQCSTCNLGVCRHLHVLVETCNIHIFYFTLSDIYRLKVSSINESRRWNWFARNSDIA